MLRNKKAQNISEYAIVIGLIGSALLMMSLYFQRGIQSVIKEPVDNLGGFASGLFSPQRIQHMGAEDDSIDRAQHTGIKGDSRDPNYGENPVFESTASLDATRTITTFEGGARKLEIGKERTDVSERISRSYQRIKYDQISR